MLGLCMCRCARRWSENGVLVAGRNDQSAGVSEAPTLSQTGGSLSQTGGSHVETHISSDPARLGHLKTHISSDPARLGHLKTHISSDPADWVT